MGNTVVSFVVPAGYNISNVLLHIMINFLQTLVGRNIRIFSIEALLIGLGTFILQEIVYFLLIMLFNQTYVPAFGMKTPLVCITPFNIISAFLITLLCSGIASLVPIRKLYKKTPVDLFKD